LFNPSVNAYNGPSTHLVLGVAPELVDQKIIVKTPFNQGCVIDQFSLYQGIAGKSDSLFLG